MSAKSIRLVVVMALALALSLAGAELSMAAKPTILKDCTVCHDGQPGVVRGKLVSQSSKFGTIQVTVGSLVWIMKYNENTKVVGAESLSAIPKDKEIAVTFTGDEKSPMATLVSAKPEFKIPDNQLMSFEQVRDLVRMGPEKGKYVLIDSRPPKGYAKGHIPWAVNIPFPAIKEKGEAVLPKDKAQMVIFYCQGET